MEKRLRCIVLSNKSKLKNISALKLRPKLLEHKIFTKAMLDDICNNRCDLFDELVTRGPDAFSEFIKVLKEVGHEEEADILNSNVPSNITHHPDRISKGLCYKILSEPLGLCLLINNVDFSDQKKRFGSDVDAKNLEKIFEKIGFLVIYGKDTTNLTAEEMHLKLSTFAADQRWKFVDSCIVIILSHGRSVDNLDVIYGTDDEMIKKFEIYDMFSNVNCPLLIGKPKIFIFQACRGHEEDDGVLHSYESTDACIQNVNSNASKQPKVSYLTDMLVVHSALPYHKSYRDHEKGSWLCQDLVEVLSEEYQNNDFETILKSVTRKVQNRLSIEGKKKQGIHWEPINLRADIYFNRNITCEYLEN